jgi:hypothetical protein
VKGGHNQSILASIVFEVMLAPNINSKKERIENEYNIHSYASIAGSQKKYRC